MSQTALFVTTIFTRSSIAQNTQLIDRFVAADQVVDLTPRRVHNKTYVLRPLLDIIDAADQLSPALLLRRRTAGEREGRRGSITCPNRRLSASPSILSSYPDESDLAMPSNSLPNHASSPSAASPDSTVSAPAASIVASADDSRPLMWWQRTDLVRPGRKAVIPWTTPTRYVTGIYALNIQAPEGTSGDWHDVFTWIEGYQPERVILVGGDTEEINTVPIYGSLGIYEGLGNLLQRGLELPDGMTEAYVANHTRAILDMLYGTLHRHGKIYNLIGAATDWLDTLEQGKCCVPATLARSRARSCTTRPNSCCCTSPAGPARSCRPGSTVSGSRCGRILGCDTWQCLHAAPAPEAATFASLSPIFLQIPEQRREDRL